MSIQSLWVSEGRPRQGPTFNERLRIRARYKYEIKRAKKAPKQAAWNRLHSSLSSQDTTSFWKTWKSLYGKNKSAITPVVNGQTSREGIAASFKEAFEKNSKPNNVTKVNKLNAKFEIEYANYSSIHSQNCNCDHGTFSLENIIDVVYGMKQGNCEDDDQLYAEHFLHAPLILFIKLASLLNYMMAHSFVLKQFKFGTIIPLIKDKHGNWQYSGTF